MIGAWLLLAACDGATGDRADSAAARHDGGASDTALVREYYTTSADTAANVDSPAFYHGSDTTHWLIATAKGTHELVVFDAVTGRELRRVGGPGSASGKLQRPNGIVVLGDSLLLVVERDNRRVQVLRLPSFAPLGTFGEAELRTPYGVATLVDSSGDYRVYVTDNYDTRDTTFADRSELGERVKVYSLRVSGGTLFTQHLRSFGDTSDAGAIRVTESILADAANRTLFVVEELESDSHIKVYDLDGRFTGRVFGKGVFPQQSEGLALYSCDGGAGYLIAVDQGERVNTFHIFDRQSFRHLAAFKGAVTHTTDGIALTQRAFGNLTAGAFAGAHADAAVSAFSWAAIATATGVRSDCTAR